MMLLNTRGDECARLWRRRRHSVGSPSFHAVSLETVRPVKYDVSSLTDFVSERLHCQLVLRACWHDGSETVVSTTLRATLWKLSRFDGVKRSSSRFTVAVVRESTPIFRPLAWTTSQSTPFLSSSHFVAIPCSTGYKTSTRRACSSTRHRHNCTSVHTGLDAWRLGPADD